MNEDFQMQGRNLSALSFEESSTGRSDQAIWTVVCKVDGEIKGTGTAATKADAKNLASKKALEALGESTA
ncbi:hypothetical protein EV360DRAFT_79541 [Lentinula raphanica]|nr:hypothetical protein EV360DRAFT_79541 [Lentinula raphanica]